MQIKGSVRSTGSVVHDLLRLGFRHINRVSFESLEVER